jgi:hypothetical protein
MSEEAPIAQLLGQLVDDGKRYARAEVELAKAKAADKVLPLKPAAILAGLGAVLALSAGSALLVGLIFALTPRLGAFGATAVVVIAAGAVAALLFYFAYKRLVEVLR